MIRIDQMIVADISAGQQTFAPFSGLRGTLRVLAARVEACVSRARQRRALAQLDAHLLRDIGVTSYDATLEASKPFWR